MCWGVLVIIHGSFLSMTPYYHITDKPALGLQWNSIINQPKVYKFNLILYLVSH